MHGVRGGRRTDETMERGGRQAPAISRQHGHVPEQLNRGAAHCERHDSSWLGVVEDDVRDCRSDSLALLGGGEGGRVTREHTDPCLWDVQPVEEGPDGRSLVTGVRPDEPGLMRESPRFDRGGSREVVIRRGDEDEPVAKERAALEPREAVAR